MVPQVMQALMKTDSFMASPTPTLVLDREFVVRAVNPAFTVMTGCPEDQLVSFGLFEVFPENPSAPESDGHVAMRRSLERVLSERRAHHLLAQRYDIPDRQQPGVFHERYWAPVNLPLIADDAVHGIVNRTFPINDASPSVVAALRALRDAVDDGILFDALHGDPRLEAIDHALEALNAVGREVAQLKEALVSRAVIDQAKGLVMADRHCSPDEAFQVLVKLSNDTNVRLSEVASALVYQAQHQYRG